MHLKGLGFEILNGHRDYSTYRLKFIHPDEEQVKKLGMAMGWPETCWHRINTLKPDAGLEDVNQIWDHCLEVIKSLGLNLVMKTELPHCKIGTVDMDGHNIEFGIQLLNGMIKAIVQGRCDLIHDPIPMIDYGTVTQIEELSPYTEPVCLYDLQHGNEACYYASEGKLMSGKRVILLVGNGWCEKLGFPYDEELGYAGIIGKTAENLRAAFKADRLPDFEDIYSGNINDFVNYKEQK